jgi:ABC-type transporter Mla MlaB component
VFKVTTTMEGGTMVLKLEGRLADQWVDELMRVAGASAPAARETMLDLSGLSFADARGIAWLREVRDRGAQLAGGSTFITALVQEPTR